MENFLDVELKLSLRLLNDITNCFSQERLIGQGGFGTVYKGVLGDGQVIAVRMLYPVGQIDDKLFQNEVASLMKIRHRNIVRLLGYCSEKEQVLVPYGGKHAFALKTHRALCFEYLQNGSLDHHISDISYGLEWKTRYTLIEGICEGLNYLHERSIIHMNLKPSNILLDQDMIPKIADFGISRIWGEEKANHIGTMGYMAPEYLESQAISIKCDIFSLGVIIIKLVTGERFYSEHSDISHEQFSELALEKWRHRLQKAVNGTPVERYCQQVRKCTETALKCVDYDRHERPSIGEIMHTLNKTETLIPQEVRAVQKRPKPLLLDVHPLELHFPYMFKGRKKAMICSLQLKNRGDERVAFMLVANIPKRYLTQKSLYGVVPPRSANTLILTKIKHTPQTSSDNNDFFTLYSVVVGQYDLLDVEKDYAQYENFFHKSKEYGVEMQVARLNVVCDRPAAKSAGTSPEDRVRMSPVS